MAPAELLRTAFLLGQPIFKLLISKTEEKWKTVVLVLIIRLNLSSNPEEILWTDRERLPQLYEQGKEGGFDKDIC